jgi:hypothetical protein
MLLLFYFLFFTTHSIESGGEVENSEDFSIGSEDRVPWVSPTLIEPLQIISLSKYEKSLQGGFPVLSI